MAVHLDVMKLCWVGFVLVSTFQGCYSYQTFPNPQNWESALSRCPAYHGNLILPTPRLIEENNEILVDDNITGLDTEKSYWVGYLRDHRYFMYLGCAEPPQKAPSFPISDTNVMASKLMMCYSFCSLRKYTILAFTDEKCYCLDESNLDHLKSQSSCKRTPMKVYREVKIPTTIPIRLGAQNMARCVSLWVGYNYSEAGLELADCKTPNRIWCQTGRTLKHFLEGRWSDSISICEGSSVLPQIIPGEDDLNSFIFQPDVSNAVLWTALRRDFIILKHQGYRRTATSECGYIRLESGKIKLKFTTCDDDRRYICGPATVSSPTTSNIHVTTASTAPIQTDMIETPDSTETTQSQVRDFTETPESPASDQKLSLKTNKSTVKWIPVIIGVAAGILVLILVIIIVIVFCLRRRRNRKHTTQTATSQNETHPLDTVNYDYSEPMMAPGSSEENDDNYAEADYQDGQEQTEYQYSDPGMSRDTRGDNSDVYDKLHQRGKPNNEKFTSDNIYSKTNFNRDSDVYDHTGNISWAECRHKGQGHNTENIYDKTGQNGRDDAGFYDTTKTSEINRGASKDTDNEYDSCGNVRT